MFRSFDLSGTANDLTATFSYNPASQIASTTRTGDAYAYTAMGNGSTAYTSNGLNQQVSIGGSTATWDANGNLATEPQSAKTYTYNVKNQLTASTGGTATSLAYDPLDRLDTYNPGVSRRFIYDGVEAAAELDSTGAVQDRYVRGDDGADELIVDYSGSGTTNRRFTSADERGSIISLTDSSGNLVGIDRYDEFGKPQSTNIGRFQYTGQAWLPEANVAYYKARTYLSHLGIFGETDPLGPQHDANLYAYVLNDPVNNVDPAGRDAITPPCVMVCPAPGVIIVTAPERMQPLTEPPPTMIPASATIGTHTSTGPQEERPIRIIGSRKPKPIPTSAPPPPPPLPPRLDPTSVAAPNPTRGRSDLACGILPSGRFGCARLSYDYLCWGAQQRLALVGAILLGKEGKLLKFAGPFRIIVLGEGAADTADILEYCEAPK